MPYACLVCDNETVKLLHHYGAEGNICNSCRTFFRRSVSQNLNWTCKSGFLNCNISTNARLYCKSCRFSKCLKVGMKPEQVDKTKKAIAAYFAEQEKNFKKSDSSVTSTVSLNDNIIVEKVCEVELIPESQDVTQPIFFDPKRSQTFGSNEACMFQQDPKMFQISRNDQLNPEDIHFFSGLVTSWRKVLLKTYLDGMSYPSVHEEIERYHNQSLDAKTLTFGTALDCTFVDVSVDNIFKASLTDLLCLKPTMQAKLRTLFQCLVVFYFSANEGITERQLLATYGYNVESHPFNAIIPVHMQDTKMVDYLKSGMFKSPWAESLDVEEFFIKTCQTLKTFLDDPVLHLCFFNLLLCNLVDKLGSSHNFLPGKLKMILYKEMLRKSQDSNLANHRFNQLISTIHDVEECARILERASLIKETHIDLQDIDVEPLEKFSDSDSDFGVVTFLS